MKRRKIRAIPRICPKDDAIEQTRVNGRFAITDRAGGARSSACLVLARCATTSRRNDASSPTSLVRALGVWGLAASIVNITVGGGIFRLPAGVAGALGAAAPLAYLVCAVAMGLIVLCFAEAGSRVALTGGPYAYVEVAFGPFVGFLCGVLLWAGITAALAAVTTLLRRFARRARAGAWRRRRRESRRSLVVLAALAALNVRGVRGASRFNAAMTVAKLLPLVAAGRRRARSPMHRDESRSGSTRRRRAPSVARVGGAHLRVSRRGERRSCRAAR